ncbi:GCN5 family acetyltransferase [Methylobacterium sp. Leaf399]|uniref:GNAT family N-acetyltransferase n=1 Tax=unclassified Methylobacterium TaxID=2615210 RepID=UPI0006F66F67|nr:MULTISPECIES: GNAT family N-acetyltransferase [unclassified Methylobacterium]KQP50446.1 GCN5 family acetyltransferase [Methylobacterium sp. Leaf108]KQT08657.1 GCN5 family acetyltransferase [Methylobacterium sp. Leaf399]KQT78693.1 GCN5 family acetyltransferase [Methylobacterium sp. Leaf466]
MSTSTISIRRARTEDADRLSDVFDETWREAYRGIIPGICLEQMIARRGPAWWCAAARRGRPLVVVEAADTIVGYASYGRTRGSILRTAGEVDEIYITPAYQGLGLGRRLFRAIRNDLADRGMGRVGVWSLADNERALAFYVGQGGIVVGQSVERLAGALLPKVGYRFG